LRLARLVVSIRPPLVHVPAARFPARSPAPTGPEVALMLSVLAWDPAALRARCRSARGLVAHLSRLARGRGAVSLIDQMIVSGTTFTTSVVIGRLLSRESLGVYFLGWNLVLLARSIQGDLITSPYMMYHRRHDPHVAPYYTGSVILH